ncbi:hypothetical protein [Oryzihumus leptocrescens]|uniref:Uncharacterized protein n=1 Tax=Oryzihumus leptocrescens TaxID=297536 RepID=A0A542ZEM2_9MICO|nr:hypothetical protein [Oryzihumus leptocrescens]TQL58784.1 hypothetical protein FB474_0122 [Oryzihumus leptocrescens]
MELEGWNSLPEGAGVVFDSSEAPLWLRVLFHLPFLDRFAHPLLVARGCGFLSVDDPAIFDPDAATAKGWRILPEDYVAPGSWAAFGPGWSTQSWRQRRGLLRAQQYVGAGFVVVVLVVLAVSGLIPLPLGLAGIGAIVGWLFWRGLTPR